MITTITVRDTDDRSRRIHALRSLAFVFQMVMVIPIQAQQPALRVLTVKKGRRAGVQLGADTVDTYNSLDGVRKPAGTVIQNRTLTTSAGRSIYLVAMTVISPSESQTFDTLAIDASTFVPLWHRTHAPTDSAALIVVDGKLTGWRVPARQERKPVEFTLTDRLFETGVAEAVRWRMPWAIGYSVSITSAGMWEPRPSTTIYRAIGSDVLDSRDKRVDAWIVQEGDEPQPRAIRKHWIEKSTGALLQSHTALASFANPTDGYWVKRR